MSAEELLTQQEANNLLLHQKTEFRLQEVDKVLTAMNDSLKEMNRNQSRQREELKMEIEREFITKKDFNLFALKTEQHWKKFNWMLAGAVAVLLSGSWAISQYSIVSKLMQAKHQYVTPEVLKEAIKEAIKESK